MPERTCVCCRKKNEKGEFFRLSKVEDSYVLDKEMKIQNRGFYVCKNQDCIEKLSKHKKYNIDMEYLMEMLRILKKKRKNIIDIIRPMKNSEFFIFGVEENIEAIKKGKVKLVILPEDINGKYISEFMKLKEKFEITVINVNKKKEIADIFSRNVNVIGIFGKKVVNGILNKMEVTNEDIQTGGRNGL